MTDIRRLGQIIMARVIAQVPELGGRVNDRSTEMTAFPNATIDTIYGTEADVECIISDEWTVQLSVWGQNTNQLKVAELAGKVRAALRGWADTSEIAMHPLSVAPPIVSYDVDGVTIRGRLMIEAMIEAAG